jgi:hypothetical protein
MNEGSLLLLCSENFNIFLWYNYIFVLLSTTTWTDIGDWRYKSMHSLNFGTRWIRVFSCTQLLLCPGEIFSVPISHTPKAIASKIWIPLLFGFRQFYQVRWRPSNILTLLSAVTLSRRCMERNVLTESDTLTSHPARIRAATTSECPADDARCKALRPFCNKLVVVSHCHNCRKSIGIIRGQFNK